MAANMSFTHEYGVLNALVPAADMNNGGGETDIVSMKQADRMIFILYTGANATGNANITVEACDDVTPTTTSAIAFYATEYETSGSDVPSTARAAVASTGFKTALTANALYVIEVESSAVVGAGDTYEFCRLIMTESTNAAVTGGVIAITANTRYKEASMNTMVS